MSAARRSNATIGEWLDRAIRQQVKAERHQTQAAGPTIEETLAKLVEGIARQAEATQQQAAAIARLNALEARNRHGGREGGGNLFVRLHGLLRRPVTRPDARNGRDG